MRGAACDLAAAFGVPSPEVLFRNATAAGARVRRFVDEQEGAAA